MLEYKKVLKRLGIYILIVIPVFIGMTYLFSLVNLPMPIAILINVVIGALLCLLFEIIYVNLKKKREEKNKNNTTKDPFAD